MIRHKILAIPLLIAALLGCDSSSTSDQIGASANGNDSYAHTAPTPEAAKINAAVIEALPLDDAQDFQDAGKGLIASAASLQITGPGNVPIWDMEAYNFIEGEAPASVNPSLWRQARLNNIHGLFKVTNGVYQLRGFDMANMSIIVGDTGWIVVDPLTSKESARAALEFAQQHLEAKPVVAVIYTHSHVDHFGGVLGVVSEASVRSGKVKIIAPSGFMTEATGENVIAGTAMGRRAMYMYGSQLARAERGHVDSGLGKAPVLGTVGILEPTDIVDRTPQRMTIDGVPFVFQNVPGSEAPAELTFYLPKQKAFCGAELISRNMHNVYTLRGTKVRDALRWSAYIDEAIQLFPQSEVYFASHHWPMWGNASITAFLKKQRDGYKYIHDQTLRLASQGYTPKEIAERLTMPGALETSFPNRGYYGTLKHNAKAVYQYYFGWYDGNPANLDPLPPEPAAKRYVKLMGGADAVLQQARVDFDAGDYRWVAQLLNHLVFAEPKNNAAKELLAATYDQLGYQAESAPWRDVYLSGAYELRNGAPSRGIDLANSVDLLRSTPIARFLDLIAAMLNGPDAQGQNMVLNFVFTDLAETHVLVLENSVLHHYQQEPSQDANATIELTQAVFIELLVGKAGARELLFSDDVSIKGSEPDLLKFFSLLDQPNNVFNIVIP